jgi:site-specific DNA-methyltransferase (adenine-specific)
VTDNGVAARHSSATDQHHTPAYIVEASRSTLGAIDLDPFSCPRANETVRAARFYAGGEEDGFVLPWEGRVFVNPPGGKAGNASNQKRAWFKLAAEYAVGRVTSAVFVCFSVELLQSSQCKAPDGAPLPLDFPMCFPAARVAYVREDGTTGDAPPHSSCVVFLPPATPGEREAAIARFRAAFEPIGRVVGATAPVVMMDAGILDPVALDVLEGRARWSLTTGDSLRLLLALPPKSIDALVTDPPYSSGGQFRGDRMSGTREKYASGARPAEYPEFDGDTRDQRAHGYWTSLWLAEAFRAAKPGAPACVFTDWRQLATTIDSFQAAGWVFRGVFVWDKTQGVRPAMGRFRSQCEFVVWGSKGPMAEERGVGVLPGFVRALPELEELPGCVSVQPSSSEKFAQTGKPLATMRAIVRICAPGGIVLDPFTGGGSTGAACLAEGLRFVGFESSPEYGRIAGDRLSAVERGEDPKAPRHQRTIFDALAGKP